MTAAVLGIDPGHRGAAVLLDPAGYPYRAWSWTALDRKAGRVYRLDDETPGGLRTSEVRHLALVGVALDSGLWQLQHDGLIDRWHLACEGLFIASVARGDAAVELGRTVGWLTAPLVHRALTYDEPRAAKWRPAVLGCQRHTKSDEAERLALLRWGARWRGELGTNPHVAEADCIAWYRRAVLRVAECQPALTLRSAR